ncbi:MAG: hypothetical protein HKM02_06220 [Pseudomonadales bacterium]|nr:hypothetical protein [Pseudomonadales bacterium]
MLVEITIFPGRLLEAKRKLYRLMVDRLGDLGILPDDVIIVLHELPLDNWEIRDGLPASDIDLGFDLNV